MTGYKHILFMLSFCILQTNSAFSQKFLHTENKKIVNGQGEEVFLRGIGLGGWMLQEGYMLETSSFANAQYEIRAKIEELIGTQNTDTFYSAWRANHVRKIDIDSLAYWGFNSIRLPMHYNLFTPQSLPVGEYIDTGFVMVDSLLRWCSINEMYLILDLHAAPGGQGDDAAICDYDPTKPSLWESEENRARTADLWKTLAARYSEEEWIGGYDLINETKWPPLSDNNNQDLWDLMIRITDSIRTVDTNHLIITEGNWWANDYTGFPGPWDDNLVISFHKYWNPNNTSSIQWMLSMRDQHNVPLWLGETGENSNTWFTEMIELMEEHTIGYSLWPQKKISSVAGPVTIIKTDGYQQLLDYWNNPGQHVKPSEEFAKATLMEITENLKLENCKINIDVIDALTRQVNNENSVSFHELTIPGRIYATDYDMGRQGIAYSDVDYQRISEGQTWNNGGAYRNDGVDIESCTDNIAGNGYNVGWTSVGEWMNYTVHIDSSAAYTLKLRYASDNALTNLHFELDGVDITGTIEVPSTGGWFDWITYTKTNVILEKGAHSLTAHIDYGGCNLNYFQFSDPTTPSQSEYPRNTIKDNLIIYPNPCSSIVYVKKQIDAQSIEIIRLLDISGRDILSVLPEYNPENNIYILDISSLASGYYVITMKIYGEIISSPFVIQ
ncbi:MAG: cellulase family glycosylhydrolase [Bacteroidales bacterium]|nr:cellulase family glycosylhydrolase [Bacteroidales bacterium]